MQVEALVKQIIASQPPELAKTVVPVSPTVQYIYNVKGVQADAAAVLRDQFPAITVTSVGQTGQLVLSGQQSQINAALELLGKVDKPVQAQSGPDLQQLIYTAKGKPEDIVTLVTAQFPALKVTPVGSTGQLVLSGQQSQINAALELLGKVDKPVQAQSGPDLQQLIYTAKGKPEDIVALIAAQFPAIKATPVGTTSQLILSGPKPQLDAALDLLGKVDKAAPVQAAPAPEVQQQQVYTAKGDPKDVAALLAAQFPALKVTPVGATEQLILSGPKSQLDTALALLKQVDRAPSVQANPAVRQQVYAVKGDQKDIAALLAAQFPGLKITPVGTTSQLVLNGTQEQLDAALALLGTVDKPVVVASGPTVQQRVFQLVNASAEELKAVLDNTLQTALSAQASDTATPAPATVPVTGVDASGNPTVVSVPNPAATTASTPTPAATAPTQNPNAATIIADKRTNTLIVRGTQAQVEQVAALIPSLDQVVPQINVQVRIQEITEDAARTLGLNWKVGFGGFNISTGATGLAASFDPTRALVGGFNLLPTLNALETQTQTKRIYDGSITMQSGQRSLGTAAGGSGTTNASSTAAASIKSGGRLELNIPSASAVSANITKQIDYGINLDFFDPQVAPDGTITLRVRGQVSQPKTAITGTSIPNVLDFSNSEAQSIVTFKSGQTLLLSGLLGTNETSTNRGVPFLSSLPVVGPAFGQKETTKTQTQLMVVITGTVVK
ncbi:secretin [Deinococcus irradiatisoli]|uniref:Secretin n=2 Tax=Deinococcus irradiatisoli TaxID=2202254 RepID=A0A2Z3JIA6_9DEIO|nr:secretin [Deinococcus irradiatisoli]